MLQLEERRGRKMSEQQEQTRIQFSLYIRILGLLLSLFATRTAAISCSIIIFLCFYIFDSYHQQTILLPGSGTLIIVLGLILTIKHSYLSNIKSVAELIAKQNALFRFANAGWEKDLKNIEKAKIAASDEGTGLVVIILGSIVSAIAPLIPLINLCKH